MPKEFRELVSNERPPLDTAIALSVHTGPHWGGAGEAGR